MASAVYLTTDVHIYKVIYLSIFLIQENIKAISKKGETHC